MRTRDLWGCAGAKLLAMALLEGCLTQKALYDDVRETRDEAYESWLRIRESGDIPIPAENLTMDESVRIALLYNKSLQAKIQ